MSDVIWQIIIWRTPIIAWQTVRCFLRDCRYQVLLGLSQTTRSARGFDIGLLEISAKK